MMAKKSGYIQRQERERRLWIRAARQQEQTFCCDIMQIALGRLGYGEKRLKDVEKVYSEAYIEYDTLREQDGQDDKEGVYFKSCLDRELQQYCGKSFVDYEARYYGTKT